MKILVVYYSRTGVTRKVARAVAESLAADSEELIDTKNRSGPIGFAVAAKDAALKKTVPIQPPQKVPGDYDLVVIGTPVWADTISTAVRAYLGDHGGDIRKAAVFCTTHTSGIEKATGAMEAMIGGEVLARAGFRQKHVKRDKHVEALNAFLDEIQGKTPPAAE